MKFIPILLAVLFFPRAYSQDNVKGVDACCKCIAEKNTVGIKKYSGHAVLDECLLKAAEQASIGLDTASETTIEKFREDIVAGVMAECPDMFDVIAQNLPPLNSIEILGEGSGEITNAEKIGEDLVLTVKEPSGDLVSYWLIEFRGEKFMKKPKKLIGKTIEFQFRFTEIYNPSLKKTRRNGRSGSYKYFKSTTPYG